jgi:hypothetical protein
MEKSYMCLKNIKEDSAAEGLGVGCRAQGQLEPEGLYVQATVR